MKALKINREEKKVQEIEIQMEANTIYSFFNSILIDTTDTLREHTIYTDANALSESKKAYFLGEQLLIGDALVVGKNVYGDIESSIPSKELQALISYEVNEFYTQTLHLLSKTDVNLYRTFILHKENEKITLNIEWVIYTFNIANIKTKQYFLNELEKNISSTKSAEEFLKKMAGLALNAS